MKNKNKKDNRKHVVLLAAVLLVLSTVLTACSSASSQHASKEEEATQKEEAVAETTEVAKEETAAEPTEEPASEPELNQEDIEQQEETEGNNMSFEEWVCQIDLEIPQLLVWNENGKQEIIEPGTEYVMEEGDLFALPFNKPIATIVVNSEIQTAVETEYGKYIPIPIEDGENIIQYRSYGERYKYIVKCEEEPASEATAEPTVYEGIDMESTLPGEEWIKTFQGIIDEPKLVVFNDSTNKKIILEEGQEVDFAMDDSMAIYSTKIGEIIECDGNVFKSIDYGKITIMKKISGKYKVGDTVTITNNVDFEGERTTLTAVLNFVE